MKRNPTIHITRSSLVEILNGIDYTQRTMGTKLADSIFEKAQPYQLTGRYSKILELKAKAKTKVKRSVEADEVPNGTVEKVNLMIVGIRQKAKPRAKIRGILKTSKQYLLLKEVAKMAYDFSEHFDIEPRYSGVKEYLEMGMDFMGKYGLNRYKTYDERIYELFESKVAVLTDDHIEDTRQFYGIWQNIMIKHSGVIDLTEIENDYRKYSDILAGRVQADKNRADYTDWIEAQFEGLSWLNVIPETYQFFGDGALKRYNAYQNNSTDRKTSREESVTDIYKTE